VLAAPTSPAPPGTPTAAPARTAAEAQAGKNLSEYRNRWLSLARGLDDTDNVLDLTRTDEFRALRSAVRDVAENHIMTMTTHPDRSTILPETALRVLDAMGLRSPRDADDGGQGIPGYIEWALIAEELGKGDAGTALDVVLGAYAAIIVGRCGADRHRRGLVPADSGSPRGTMLYFEGFGRAPLELETTATAAGDGWAVSGRKTAVIRPDSSDYGVVIARRGTAGLCAVHLPRACLATLSVIRDDGAAGKIGLRSAATSTVGLAALTGGELLDTGPEIELHRSLAGMRLAVASILIGTADAAIRYAAGYAADREAFGRPIAGFQGVAFPLVDAEIALDAARLAIWDLAAGIDRAPDPRYADPSYADPRYLAEATSAAVAAAAQAGAVGTAIAVNTLGGHGYLTDHPVERWYRDAAALAAIDFDPLLTEWSAIR
jgi:alkylation response protein AidB-like acyl-CoA dehydrogenase